MDPRVALRERREAAKLNRDQAAGELECSKDMLAGIERGIRMPGRRLANQIKARFEIPTEAWDRLEDDEQAGTAHDEPSVPVLAPCGEARR